MTLPAADNAGRLSRIGLRAVSLSLVLLMAGFCLLAASMLLTMRQETWAEALRTSQNLLTIEGDNIDRTFTVYDTAIGAVAATFRDPAPRDPHDAVRHLGIPGIPELGPIRVLDADGSVIHDSSTPTPPAAAAAERQALADQRHRLSDEALVGPPFRTGAGGYAVTLSHRIGGKNAAFSGIVIGTIDLDLFVGKFRRLDLGPHDVVSLFSTSGVMLAHVPGDPLIGRSITGSPLLSRFLTQRTGVFVAPAALDGIRRVFSFTHIGRWPLFLDVGLSTHDLYKPWRGRAMVTGLLLVVMASFTLGLVWLLRRDLRARQTAEKALVASEALYRLLAESANDLIVRVDQDMIVRYASASCRRFGYEPSDLVGLKAGSWAHLDDIEGLRGAVRETADAQGGVELTYRARHKDGRYSWVEAHWSRVEPGGYLAILRDIDQRKRQEQVRESEKQELAHFAATDALTRLANRRVFDQTLATAWQNLTVGHSCLSLLLLDVDHFKAYNDRYGHQAGDAMLAKVAQVIGANVKRAGDLAARYGGEEFAVILPGTDLFGATEVAQAICLAVRDLAAEHAGAPSGRVTVSIGVASALPSQDDHSTAMLVRSADEALYEAKHGGRNQIRVKTVAAAPEAVRGEPSRAPD